MRLTPRKAIGSFESKPSLSISKPMCERFDV